MIDIFQKPFEEMTNEERAIKLAEAQTRVRHGNLWSDARKYIFRNKVFLVNALRKMKVVDLTPEEVEAMHIVEEYIPGTPWKGKTNKENTPRDARFDVYATIDKVKKMDLEIQRYRERQNTKRVLFYFGKMIADRNAGKEDEVESRDHIAVWLFENDISRDMEVLGSHDSLPYYMFTLSYHKNSEWDIVGLDESFSLLSGDRIIFINGGFDWEKLEAQRPLTKDEEDLRNFVMDMFETDYDNIRDDVTKEVLEMYTKEEVDSDLVITIAREMSDASKVFVKQREKAARAEAIANDVWALVQELDISLDKAMDLLHVDSSDRQDVLSQIELLCNKQ